MSETGICKQHYLYTLQFSIDPAPASWIKVVGMLPTHPTYPPRTLPSWIIKANPSCFLYLLILSNTALCTSVNMIPYSMSGIWTRIILSHMQSGVLVYPIYTTNRVEYKRKRSSYSTLKWNMGFCRSYSLNFPLV